MHSITLGIGANLPPDGFSGPREGCMAALEELKTQNIEITGISRWFETAPVPISDQPWFVNAVIIGKTAMTASETLAVLHHTEAQFGRKRRVRNEARVLDIDLLDFDRMLSDKPELVLPHPRMHQRAFVLYPLRDLMPDWVHPVSGVGIGELIEDLPPDQPIRPVQD